VELLQETNPALSLKQCVALEDSTPGVAAAVASGVATVAIPHIVPLPEDERYVLWESLAGRSLADLEEVVRTGSLSDGSGQHESIQYESTGYGSFTLEGAGVRGTAHD
jgi:hypothetical protein